jgi:hypothetical protein
MDQEDRQNLHQEIPYQSMIRWPQLQKLEDVPVDYLKNCADLSNVLTTSFGIAQDDGTISLSNQFKVTLGDPQRFTDWVLDCHRTVCLGSGGNRPYGGRSDGNINPSEYAGKLRTDDTQVIAILHQSQQRNVFAVAVGSGDPLACGHRDFEAWFKARRSGVVLKYFPVQEIPGRGLESLVIGNLPGPYASTDIGSRVALEESYKPNLSGNLLYAAADSEVIFYYPPGVEYIRQFLNVMRIRLIAVCNAIEQRHSEAMLTALAGYYQTAIRSQAVRGIWNSVLMGQVNEILHLTHHTRLSHMELDILAFCLEDKPFQAFFRWLVVTCTRKGSSIP